MLRFRIAGEYFDDQGEANTIAGGSFSSLSMARRAFEALQEYIKAPESGTIPAELEHVAAIAEPATWEIALYYRSKNNVEEWVMSFDPETGAPIEVTPDATLAWKLIKQAMRR